MEKKQIKPNKIIYFYYAAIYYFCISIILIGQADPVNRSIVSLLLFLVSLGLFFIFMTKGFFTKRPRKSHAKLRYKRKIKTEYSSSITFALISSVSFLLAIVCYALLNDKILSFTWMLISLVLFFVASSIFLSENHTYNQHYKSALSWIVKIGWIAGSFYAYALARHDFMNIADLTYEQTASRFYVILYAGLIVVTYSASLVILAGLFLYKFEEKSINVNAKEIWIIRDSSPLSVPISMAAMVILLMLISNTKLIFNTALNISIPVDTTNTFKCNGTPMVLGNKGEHYYLLVKEDEYRVFTYRDNNWYALRLSCHKDKPYFSTSEIKSKREIVESNFSSIKKNALDNFNAIIN